MAKLKVVDTKGKEKGDVDLALMAVVKPSVLHRAVVAEEANNRQGTQKAKTRAEVRGGGRKPYRQKKTGRSRQGSIRSPLHRKGGVVFAPVPRDYSKKVNRKERRLALQSAFATQADQGRIIVVDKIDFDQPKTKLAVELLNSIGANVQRVLVILPSYDEVALKAFRNLRHVEVRTAPSKASKDGEQTRAQGFSTRDLLVAHKVVVSKDALAAIQEAWS
jgi:large subunit ribosomal protein L4